MIKAAKLLFQKLYHVRLKRIRSTTPKEIIANTLFSLDSIDARYKLAINDVRRLHSRVLSAQVNET